jgi:cytochrome c-type biogenesis protein CcmH/NrfG
MTGTNLISSVRWTRERAAFLAIGCLLAGIAGGWSIHGPRTQGSGAAPAVKAASLAPSNPAATQTTPQADSEHLKRMADAQAAPLLDKLKADHDNPELLISLGNLYYDAQQYPIAVDYYARSLKARPADAAVRTDMATAFWYMGNANKAIAEFNQALTYVPNNPNTLFNLGLVEWKGKRDAAAARTAWQKLLATDPTYEQKDQVEKMLAEVNSYPPGQAVAGVVRH